MGGRSRGTRIGIHGWWGQYLTAYDTGLLGGYGLYASHSVDGFFKHVYASGFNDSGVYVGGCRDCHALVQDALVERNALGWSSTNAGGHLIVEDSTFRDNSVGVAPDSEPDDDLPPPQDGACNSASNRKALPTFTSTQIDRCTIFANNLIEDNGNISSPANSDILNAPWGEGVVLGGDYADLVEDNTIRDNPTFGVLVLERPDPFPPTSKTVYFQSSGNRGVGQRDHGQRDGVGHRRHRPRGRPVRNAELGQQLLLGQHVRHLEPGRHRGDVGLPEHDDAQRRRRPVQPRS